MRCIAEVNPRHRQDMADAAGQPACTQVSRCTWLYGSDRKLPDGDWRPGMQRALAYYSTYHRQP
jgi:hypothetical protein